MKSVFCSPCMNINVGVQIKWSSFKTCENIPKKEDGSGRSASNYELSSLTLNELSMKTREGVL